MENAAKWRGHRIRFLAAILIPAALLLAAGCGDDEPSQPAPEEPAAEVEVSGTEYAFDLPEQIEGGWVTMDLTNQGAEPHEFALGKIEEGHTAEELDEVLRETAASGRTPKWIEPLPGVGVMTAGESIELTPRFEPGDYAFLCFLPGPGGKTHLELGMQRGFTVSGDPGASPPQPDAVVTATDDNFEVPALTAGEQMLEVRNEGEQENGFELVTYEPGEDFAALNKWARGGFRGAPPAALLGGAIFLPPGESMFLTVDLDPDTTYTFVNPDRQVEQPFTVE